jgi:hypothetical protein
MIPPRSRLPLVAALLLLGAACESGVAETARRLDEARAGCTEEKLRAGDEECVRMMERYMEMGSEAVETYLGALRTFDRALQRQPGLAWDTAGLGRAITPYDVPGGSGAEESWEHAGDPAFSLGAGGAPGRGADARGRSRRGTGAEPRERGPWRDPYAPGGYAGPAAGWQEGRHGRPDRWTAGGHAPRWGERFDPRHDPRHDPRYGPAFDPRVDPRYGPAFDPRYDPRYDPPYGRGHDPRYGASYHPGYPPYDPRYPSPYDARGYGYPVPSQPGGPYPGESLYEEEEYDERWEVRPDLTAGRAADPVRTPPSRGWLRPPEERLRRPEPRPRDLP